MNTKQAVTKEDWSSLNRTQRLGYFMIRYLGILQQWCYHKLIGEIVWRTAEGRCIPLSKITDNHMYNIIKMLERTGEQPEFLRLFKQEFAKRIR
jgi:hypothetical protein